MDLIGYAAFTGVFLVLFATVITGLVLAAISDGRQALNGGALRERISA